MTEYTYFDAVEMRHAKGEGMGMHRHDYAHRLTVLLGMVLVQINQNRFLLMRGEWVFFHAGDDHGWVAEEDGTVVLGLYPQNAAKAEVGALPHGGEQLADLPQTGTGG